MAADTKPLRVAIYCRVSTMDQTTANQRIELERYATQRGWSIVEVFEDTGISGSVEKRPGLDKLMQDARRGMLDVVAVWRFDRFARSTAHLLAALEEFRQLHVGFVSYSEGIDTSTSTGKLVLTFLGAVAEFEREIIKERVRSGIKRAQSQNIHCGRPRKGFDVPKAIELHEQGWGWTRIGRQLGVSGGTVRTTLLALQKPSSTAA